MRISIRHEIAHTFVPPAKSVLQVLRLKPRDCDSQHVANWMIDVDADCSLRDGQDAFGNLVQTLDADGKLEKLTIVAHGEVETVDTHGVLRGEPERFPPDVYLRDTDFTTSDEALRDFARDAVKTARTPLDKPHMLMAALHKAMKFDAGEAVTILKAAEAFKNGVGDSAAFAHVLVAASRAVGAPARCVSGYLAPDKAAREKGVTGAAPHAWAEVYVEGLGWIGFDATICLCMHDGHVRVACGLDYTGAAPQRVAPLSYATRNVSLRVVAQQAASQRQS